MQRTKGEGLGVKPLRHTVTGEGSMLCDVMCTFEHQYVVSDFDQLWQVSTLLSTEQFSFQLTCYSGSQGVTVYRSKIIGLAKCSISFECNFHQYYYVDREGMAYVT